MITLIIALMLMFLPFLIVLMCLIVLPYETLTKKVSINIKKPKLRDAADIAQGLEEYEKKRARFKSKYKEVGK